MSPPESIMTNFAAQCQGEIPYLTDCLNHFPPGTLAAFKNGIYTRYRILIPGNDPIHVPSNDNSAKEHMARKKVFQAKPEDSHADLDICLHALKKFDHHPHAMDQLLSDEHICSLLAPKYAQMDSERWTTDIGSHNPKHPEHLIVPTEAGICVRSKAESIIAAVILDLELLFTYEHELTLEGVTYYPDFTVLNPRTHRIYYISSWTAAM